MWKADGPELSALEGRRSRQGPPQESTKECIGVSSLVSRVQSVKDHCYKPLMESLEAMVGAIVLPQMKALT
jgi:hypothetical protein